MKRAVEALKHRGPKVFEIASSRGLSRAQKDALSHAKHSLEKEAVRGGGGRTRLVRGEVGAWLPRSASEEVTPSLRTKFSNVTLAAVHPPVKAPVERAVASVLKGERKVYAAARQYHLSESAVSRGLQRVKKSGVATPEWVGKPLGLPEEIEAALVTWVVSRAAGCLPMMSFCTL